MWFTITNILLGQDLWFTYLMKILAPFSRSSLDRDVCGKHFSYNWFVQRHKKQVHFKETVDFICTKCKKTYKKKTPTGHTY